MKSKILDRITRNFILNENDPRQLTITDHVRAVLETLGRMNPKTETERSRVAMSVRHLKEIRRHSRRLQEQVNTLQEQIKVLEESKR